MALGLFGGESGRLTEVAAQATAADPDLAPAQVAKDMAAATRGEALGYYRRAIELDRSYGLAYRLIGGLLTSAEPDLAARFLTRADGLEMTPSGGAGRSESEVAGEQVPLGATERELLEALLDAGTAPAGRP
jgi:hypothetical protein